MNFKKVLTFLTFYCASWVVAAEGCMLFTNPESCVGKSSTILNGMKFDVHETEGANLYVISPRNNPTGLIIRLSTNDGVIYNIRYSNSTARSAPSPEEFEGFKNVVRKTRPASLWAVRRSGTGNVEIFEDNNLKIAIFVNAVVLHSYLHYSPNVK